RRAIDNAICAVTNDDRKRAAERAPECLPVPARIVDARSGRVLCSAGNMPNSTPVASDNTAAQMMAEPWRLKSIVLDVSVGRRPAMRCSVQYATKIGRAH